MGRFSIKQLYRKLVSVVLCIMLSFAVFVFVPADMPEVKAAVTFDGGDGSAVNPYRISNVNQFSLITLGAGGKNKYYLITNNITTASNQTTPLINGQFYGILDGNGYSITLKQGLCGIVGPGGVIKNLNFNCTMSGNLVNYHGYRLTDTSYTCYVGCIAACNYGLIDNCSGSARLSLNGTGMTCPVAGGIVGVSYSGTVRNCGITNSDIYVTMSNSSDKGIYLGGLIGQCREQATVVDNCFYEGKARATVSAAPAYVATGVGYGYQGSLTVRNSYFHNTAAASDFSGTQVYISPIGYMFDTSLSCSNCYYRSDREPNQEWATGNAQNFSGLTRVTSNPSSLYTANNATYRKQATSLSFASYASNTAFGRTNLTLNANGGTTVVAGQKVIGSTLTLPSPTRAGYTLKGWGTSATATTVAYAAGAGFQANNGGTLYALWTPNNYSVHYNLNKPSSVDAEKVTGSMEDQAGFTYDTAKNLSANAFAIDKYVFNSWNTKADGSGQTYKNGVSVKNLTTENNGTAQLYAIWDYLWNLDSNSKDGTVTASFNTAVAQQNGLTTPVKKKFTIQMNGDSFTYDSNPHSPTVDYDLVESFEEATDLSLGQITYYAYKDNAVITPGGDGPEAASVFGLAREGEEEPEYSDSDWILIGSSAPSDVGLYKAVIPVGDYSLAKVFSIIGTDDINYSYATGTDTTNHKTNPLVPESSANRANLSVHITDAADEISIYKVAEITYNSDNNVYENPVWLLKVRQWILEKGYEYDTPALLGAAFASDSKSFYAAMKSDLIDSSESTANHLTAYEDADGNSVFFYQGENWEEALDPTILIPNLEMGQYVIVAKNPARSYAPVIVNIVPSRTGALGAYFLEDYYEVWLKDAEAGILKYIVKGAYDSATPEDPVDVTDSHMDTVSITEEVRFRLVVDMPNYSDRITLSADTVNVHPYTFEITDLMDQSMVLKDIDGNQTLGNADLGGIGIYYHDPAGNLLALPGPTDPQIVYFEYADESYVTQAGETKNPVSALPEGTTTLTEGYYVQKTANLYTVELISTQTIDNTSLGGTALDTQSGFVIHVNMAAMKHWAKSMGLATLPRLEVRYSGIVTEDVRVASELNKNDATITYEISGTGDAVTDQTDTVKVYTYGLNLHKIDGDTNEALAGANFHLYKKVGQIIDGGEFTALDERQAELITYTKLSEFKADPAFYIYSYTEESTAEDIDAIFMLVDYLGNDGVLVSTVAADGTNEAGDQFKGLSEGDYVLEEFVAPTGYNRVDSEMLFTIASFSEAEVLANGYSGLAAFKENDGSANTTGYYAITVLNYKGLVLPSTGGVGTVIFTMLGAGLMILAVAVSIRKRRFDEAIYE